MKIWLYHNWSKAFVFIRKRFSYGKKFRRHSMKEHVEKILEKQLQLLSEDRSRC